MALESATAEPCGSIGDVRYDAAMKMPHCESATVPREKVADYLLSPTHPRGSMKARWFNALGYSIDCPDELIGALKEVAMSEVDSTEKTEYGIKYKITEIISGPNGRSGSVQTIWILLPDFEEPRLVTAYPSK